MEDNNRTAPEVPDGPLLPNGESARRPKTGLIVGLSAAAVGFLILVGAAVAVTIALVSGSFSPAPESTPIAVVDPPEIVEPGENEPVWYERINTNPTAEDIILDSDQVSPEELPEVFVTDRLIMWTNAGYSPELAAELKGRGNTSNVATEKATEFRQLFADNLLVDDWESNPNLTYFVDRRVAVHDETLYFALKTSYPELSRANIEPYGRFIELVDVSNHIVSEDGNTVSFELSTRGIDNADLNEVGEGLSNYENISGNIERVFTEFTVINGQYRLSDFRVL